ncbi:MAG: hypothetical protein FWC69_02005 [Defluviitaleaceae bacterium]|nr:hypothetical protein [Defluviitaleaceae bacterium]
MNDKTTPLIRTVPKPVFVIFSSIFIEREELDKAKPKLRRKTSRQDGQMGLMNRSIIRQYA